MNNDLISKSAALEELEKHRNMWDKNLTGDMYHFTEVRQIINETSSPWIPVSKNMPKESGRYLINQGNSRFKTILIKYYDLGKKEFGTWHELPFDDEEVWIPISDVIAWMPLPESYKEGAENE